MAGFHSNTCTYGDCRRNFNNLNDLFYHIEDEHIDFDPATLAEKEVSKPSHVPLSYVLKFSAMYPKEKQLKYEPDPLKCEEEILIDSDDSWNEDYGPDVINTKDSLDVSYQCKRDPCQLKRFACPIPGCNKRYKNINGIKYHTRNGHDGKKSPIKPKKAHRCQCGKSYKTIQGLKAHMITHKEFLQPFHRSQVPHPQMLPPLKLSHMYKPYIKHEMMSGNMGSVIKNEVFDEDVLTYSYLEQVPKLSDTIQAESGNSFGLLPPSSFSNMAFSFNENFVENFVVEDHHN